MTEVNTVKVVDPRIDPQPNPSYCVNVGPQQNQVYKINWSALSNSYIAFNNITTLGAGRAFLDTFEIEVTAEITLVASPAPAGSDEGVNRLNFNYFTFDSFPFSKCCEEIRANINGGAFFNSPLQTLRAKERYWDQKKLIESYGNVCPCIKPMIADESLWWYDVSYSGAHVLPQITRHEIGERCGLSRCQDNIAETGHAPYFTGTDGIKNNYIIDPWKSKTLEISTSSSESDRTNKFTVTWREPVFCPPFSSRMDETFGRPLYNITSIDLAFNLQNLGNMIKFNEDFQCVNYSIDIKNAQLCYQVLTLPPEVIPPPVTVTPYRRMIPYVTEMPEGITVLTGQAGGSQGMYKGRTSSMQSGVYTLNEVPTAIWIYVGATKANLQQAPDDSISSSTHLTVKCPSHNKLAMPITRVSLTMANTTQIFNTFESYDLYRMAKNNGCQDSYFQFSKECLPIYTDAVGDEEITNPDDDTGFEKGDTYPVGTVGSFLRIIPGKDIILPDQPLIPGANANNMVFQATVEFLVPNSWPVPYRIPALWIFFEYVGVATITPGQCNITMNPLGDGKLVWENLLKQPAISTDGADLQNAISTVEGSGWWDKITGWVEKHPWIKEVGQSLKQGIKDSHIVSQLVSQIPHVGPYIGPAIARQGWGEQGLRPAKRARGAGVSTGGAVMGMGDFI